MDTIESDLQRLTLIMDGLYAGVWDWDINTGKEWWSPTLYQLIGYREGEIEASYRSFIRHLVHPDDRQRVEQSIAEHFTERKPFRLEIRMKHKEGHYLWIESAGKASFDESGKPVRMCGSVLDITEKKLLHLQLKEQKELLEEVCTMTNSGGWEVDFATQRSIWSKQVYHICQMPDSYRPTLEDALSFYTPESAARLSNCIKLAVERGQPWDEELQLITGKNNMIWIRALGKPIYDQQRTLIGMKGVIQDISTAKQAEIILKESELRWQFALEGAGDGVWDWNALTNEVFFSTQWKRMLGYDEDEVGNTLDEWERRVHPDDISRCYADLQAHFNKEKSFYLNEHRMRCKDGSYKWILDRGKVITWNDDGKPLRVIGTHSDVTYLKQAEALIKESEEKFHQLFENSPVGICQVETATGRVVEVNTAFTAMIGYSQQELLLLDSFLKLWSPESLIIAQHSAGNIHTYKSEEAEFICKSQSRINVLLESIQIENHKGKSFHWIFVENITSRKAKEMMIQSLNEELMLSNVQKDRLMALLAHDLRSPIASVDGLLWVIISEMKDLLTEELSTMLVRTKERVTNTSMLIDELLYWSLSQSDQISINPVMLSLTEVVNKALEVLQTQASIKKISIYLDVPEGLTIVADIQVLQAILRNLIANAIKFSYTEGKIWIKATRRADFVEISIIDHGIGISAENLQKLLNRKNNFTTPGTTGEKGTGLGLNLSMDLAQKHGGNLFISSELHKGSTFTVVLPTAYS